MMTIDDLLDRAHAFAESVLVGQEGAALLPTFLIQFKTQSVTIIATPWSNQEEKVAAIENMRLLLRAVRGDVVNYSFVSEAWAAHEDENHPIGLMPAQREDRREVVIINACDHEGGKMRCWSIERDDKGRVSGLIPDPHGAEDRFSGRLANLLAGE